MNIAKLTLASYLRELRKQKDQTLHKVSISTDIDSPLLSKLERGERLPTFEQLRRLSKYYDVSDFVLKTMLTAERIVKEFGINDITYDAVKIVGKRIVQSKRK